jgi:alpha-L-fucosidase
MNRQRRTLGRRDLFWLAGAGTAAALSAGVAVESSAVEDPPVRSGALCWEEVNATDPARRRLWEQQMSWFNEAKFGMFIHWGPVSLASVEISWPIMRPERKWNISQDEYVNLFKRFNPVRYDPDAWVELARQSGQRYMVLVTKHHDGFCMFDSSFTDYKIANTAYKKDIVRMLGEACERANMPLGYYYSPPDMQHPAYRDTSRPARENWQGEPSRPEWPLYLRYMELQLRELLCRYRSPCVIWFDGLDHQEKYDGYQVTRMIREISPITLVNNRIGVPGDFDTPEQYVPERIPVKGIEIQGTDTALQHNLPAGIPSREGFKPWETCMTINDTWAYNKNDKNFKPARQLIRTLVDVASKGGNFLLNVGPSPEGTVQPEFQERLREIGQWLAVNGESIYGTTFGPLQDLPWGRTTSKGDVVYVHVFEWPSNANLELPDLQRRVLDVRALDGGQKLEFTQSVKGLSITLPSRAPDANDTVLAVRV